MKIFNRSLFLFFVSFFFAYGHLHADAIEVDKVGDFQSILPQCDLFIDEEKKYSIDDAIAGNIPFEAAKEEIVVIGFRPKLSTWVQCDFRNGSDAKIKKTLRYNHPLETHIYFYDSSRNYEPFITGDFHRKSSDRYLTHVLPMHFGPHEEKTVFLNVIGYGTVTLLNLELWDGEQLEQEEQDHQLMLTLLFGAISALILYNLFLFLFTRDMAYFYYTGYAFTMLLHQSLYTCMAQLHVFKDVSFMNYFFIFLLVIGPITFAIPFMRQFFDMKARFPKISRFLLLWLMMMYALIPFGLSDTTYGPVINFFITLDTLGLYLLTLIAYYLLFRGVQEAKYIVVGWSVFTFSQASMALYGWGISDLYVKIPYLVEGGMFIEMLFFSIALSARIKTLQMEKKRASTLELLLEQKNMLFREIHHRVKNNLQLITSLLRLQSNTLEDAAMKESFSQAESRVNAMGKVHELLYAQDDISHIDIRTYLENLTEELHASYPHPEMIDIDVKGTLTLPMEKAIHLGLIVNELVLNSFKYAFNDQEGEILITISTQNNEASLIYEDSGEGFEMKEEKKNLGSRLIRNLAEEQLGGKLRIESEGKTLIEVRFLTE